MTVGEILDKALKITPRVVKSRFLLVLVYSLLQTLQVLFSSSKNESLIILSFAFSLVGVVILWWIMISAIKIGNEIWNGRDGNINVSVKTKEVFKFLWLSFRISFVSFLYALLLIVPGVVYFTNRILAPYILIVDQSTIKEALNKSKLLMTGEKWYKFSSPVMRITGFFIISFIISFVIGFIGVGAFSFFVAKGNNIVSAPIGLIAYMLTIIASVYNIVCMLGLYIDLSNRYLGADLVGQLDTASTQGAYA